MPGCWRLAIRQAKKQRVRQPLADLLAGIRAVGLVPLRGPVQRPEQAEHRGSQVKFRVEYPGPAAIFDDGRHNDLILAAFLDHAGKVLAGEITPLVEYHKRTFGILRDDRNMPLDQLPEANLGTLGSGDSGIPEGEELVDSRFDNLLQERLFAIDMRI